MNAHLLLSWKQEMKVNTRRRARTLANHRPILYQHMLLHSLLVQLRMITTAIRESTKITLKIQIPSSSWKTSPRDLISQ